MERERMERNQKVCEGFECARASTDCAEYDCVYEYRL